MCITCYKIKIPAITMNLRNMNYAKVERGRGGMSIIYDNIKDHAIQ